MLIFDKIQKSTKTLLAVLIDPDKASDEHLNNIAKHCNSGYIDFIFVGGSIVENSVSILISKLKQKTSISIVIFPGNHFQVSDKADAILFLSLISGRNSEFLIGNHVLSAKRIKKSGIEVIPTGYILIEGGKMTSVEYISNTKPIPADKSDIACSTAIAGELLGMKSIYLESGSGAEKSVNIKMIEDIKNSIDIPLIIGGGIKTTDELLAVSKAGANVIVIGTLFEQNPDLIPSFYKSIN